MFGPWQIEEFRQPLAESIFGHPAAAGATAVGAYNPFTPEIPEPFTSSGGDLVFPFDANGNRLARPEIRRKPEISATDGGNTTFFVADTIRDDDAFPNFFGTSASAPHATAIAALVLDRRGGSLTAGRFVNFGVDRDEVLSAFGDSEEGQLRRPPVRRREDAAGQGGEGAVSFEASLSTGRTIRGAFVNRIGAGFTPLDGFGFLDAARAVGAGAPRPGRAVPGGHGGSRSQARREHRQRHSRVR